MADNLLWFMLGVLFGATFVTGGIFFIVNRVRLQNVEAENVEEN